MEASASEAVARLQPSFAARPAVTEDLYDFSGVSSDLAILRSQLLTTLEQGASLPTASTMASLMGTTIADDDEEWYPPSPPIYDVADKLIEINRDHYNDPHSSIHLPGKLRWRPDHNLVQIKWLYGNENYCEVRSEYSDSEETSSSEDECSTAIESLAARLASRLNFHTGHRLELPTIEDVSPDTSEKTTINTSETCQNTTENTPVLLNKPPPPVILTEEDYYEDEDFEEPSIGENIMKSPLNDENLVSVMETIEMSSVSSSSSESCKTTRTSLIRPVVETTKPTILVKKPPVTEPPEKPPTPPETNNNVQRLSRPRTKTTVIRTHSTENNYTTTSTAKTTKRPNSSSYPQTQNRRSASMPKNSNHSAYLKVSNRAYSVEAPLNKTSRNPINRKIKMATKNNNNSCSSSGEEGNFSSSSVSYTSSGPMSAAAGGKHPLRSSNVFPPSNTSKPRNCPTLQPLSVKTRKTITNNTSCNNTESRPKTTPLVSDTEGKKSRTSVYINGPHGTNASLNNAVPTSKSHFLQRKNSRNSLSSNSSVSSQTTEDGNSSGGTISGSGSSSSSNSLNSRRSMNRSFHRHPSVMTDVMNNSPENPYFAQWKLRKREEKKLRERKSFLEQQMFRHQKLRILSSNPADQKR